VGRDSLAQSV